MSAPSTPAALTPATVEFRTAAPGALSTFRLNIMRVGYLVMAVGLAAVAAPGGPWQ